MSSLIEQAHGNLHNTQIGMVKEMDLAHERYNSNDSNEIKKGKALATKEDAPETTERANIDEDQEFLSHCIGKYSTIFLTEWTKTINFRIWAVEHNPEVRCLSENAGYFDEVSVFYENGEMYKGALYKGKKLGKTSHHKN